MTIAAAQNPPLYGLVERLPTVRGRYRPMAELASTNWFRVGGAAEVLFKPEDADDLAAFLRGKPADVPVQVIGVGSNLIVRDGGLDGVVIRLGRGFTELRYDAEHGEIHAGAGNLDVNVAQFAAEQGGAGLEFLVGIPGTLGGALAMNAGAYGSDIAQVLIYAEALDAQGNLHRIPVKQMGFSYRHCTVPKDWVFTKAVLRVEAGDKAEILTRMQEISSSREATQPVRSRTGGSTFKNPSGKKAWEVIDAAGGRGMMLGAAQVSELHCNFLINTGGATAAELEQLGEAVREKVYQHSGVRLEWEIKRIGKALG